VRVRQPQSLHLRPSTSDRCHSFHRGVRKSLPFAKVSSDAIAIVSQLDARASQRSKVRISVFAMEILTMPSTDRITRCSTLTAPHC
jgi:hypothetical protein